MESTENKRYFLKEGKELRVAISGSSGCGNTTVSRLLAETLDISLINYTFRSLAQEQHIPLEEIIERAKTDDSFDRLVDTKQVELARESSCVLGSRLAVWMLAEADLKVFLTAAPEVRAKRILNREGGDLEAIRAFTELRDREDTRRYKELYDIDNTDFSFVDLVIDTEKELPAGIVARILVTLEQKGFIDHE